MARTRSGQDLINDAYARSDLESAEDRHARATVLQYVNQGCAALYDLLVEARGPAYFRTTAPNITTLADTSEYDLPGNFYQLISVRLAGQNGDTMEPFQAQDEPSLRLPTTVSYPRYYQIRAGKIELLPKHAAGSTVVLDYVPTCPALEDSLVSLFDGINGWEEYVVCYAAKMMATKDQDWDVVHEMRADMKALTDRVLKLAPKRDAFRAERVKNVRGPGPGLGLRRRLRGF
jgi:hypothetical protein